MNVSLTPELEKHVQYQVDTGHYRSASEVIREVLRNQVKASQDENVKDCYTCNTGGYRLL